MVIIPAIDVRNGRTVRLVQGDVRQERVYADDPVAVARRWTAEGARWLHVVDLDGAFAGHPVHLDLVRTIADPADVRVQVGGGFRTVEDIEAGLAAGASRVIVGTSGIALGATLAARFGTRLAVSLDVKDGRVAVQGWTEVTSFDPIAVGRTLASQGVARFILTNVTRDGTLAGPDVDGVRAFTRAVGVPVIAAGGISSNDDVIALAANGVEGVIVGRALYDGRVDLGALLARWRAPAC